MYMYKTNRPVLFWTLFVNYGLPYILEKLPWYLSQRLLAKEARDTRNALQHSLVAGKPIVYSKLFTFAWASVVFSLVQTAEQILRNRVDAQNRMIVRRLIMERILYSEMGALQKTYFKAFNEEVRTDVLEGRVMNDISETLNLFNFLLPNIVRGGYEVYYSTRDLLAQRNSIAPLAILRPTIIGFLDEFVSWLRMRLVTDQQVAGIQVADIAMSKVITGVVDGLAEIQVNNMQQFQLQALDRVVHQVRICGCCRVSSFVNLFYSLYDRCNSLFLTVACTFIATPSLYRTFTLPPRVQEVEWKQGTATCIDRVIRSIGTRGIFDFISEVYVTESVMRTQGIDHETYRKVALDVDSVVSQARRLYNRMSQAWDVLDAQARVVAMLNLPNFLHEEEEAMRAKKRALKVAEIKAKLAEVHAYMAISGMKPPSPPSTPAPIPSPHTSPTAYSSSSSSSSTASAVSSSSAMMVPTEINFKSLEIGRVIYRYRSYVISEALAAAASDIPLFLQPRAPTPYNSFESTSPSSTSFPSFSTSAPTSSSSSTSGAATAALQSSDAHTGGDEDREEGDGGIYSTSSLIGTTERRLALCVQGLKDIVKPSQTQLSGDASAITPAASSFIPSTSAATNAADATLNASATLDANAATAASQSTPCERLVLERGKRYALVGQNRSGKSTLVKAICRLLPLNEDDEDGFCNKDNVASKDHVSSTQLSSASTISSPSPPSLLSSSYASSEPTSQSNNLSQSSVDECMELFVDGVPLTHIPRSTWRNVLSYMAQVSGWNQALRNIL